MRHLKSGRRLGVDTAHRRAMLRNMVTSLLENQQITCTLARAKELRGPLDKMITLGKRGDLHARRQALTFVKSKKSMEMLFGELAERYKDRSGGYSRIIRLAKRRLGDGAEMVIIQLIDSPQDVLSSLKKPKRSHSTKQSQTVLQEVSQEISQSPVQAVSE
ncbi:MAG: 50S ribosomal protein L17 [SAR324 cluster bacterium]|nr:50S ribosomal protein L17 [SAR324 cluster bacterium]MBF0353195.1 50S ribosomal protein L17 [SAR324 cluster bacterium]